MHELGALLREVLHDEPGDDEREERVELQVVEHLRRAEADGDEHDEELLADDAEVHRQEQAERSADRDAPEDLVS
jgi:hypothetical protein